MPAGGAEVLQVHMDDEDPHAVQNDDADVEDAKFAAAILQKNAAIEADEQVYEGLEAGDEDMAWVPPSMHRVRVHLRAGALGFRQTDAHVPSFCSRPNCTPLDVCSRTGLLRCGTRSLTSLASWVRAFHCTSGCWCVVLVTLLAVCAGLHPGISTYYRST